MAYKEPTPVFASFASIGSSDNSILLHDSKQNILEISYFSGIGWQIEVRHDLTNKKITRQSFTGAQENLQKEKLTYNIADNNNIDICASDSQLHIDGKIFQIRIYSEGKLLFQSAKQPFSYHKSPVEMYENLMSLKVTDYSKQAPFASEGTLFDTQMVRFQYMRPTGTVLGIPGQAGELNRNGNRFQLYNTDEFTHIPGRSLYQSWPILFHKSLDTNTWVGIFHDNPSRTFADIGDFYEESVTFESVTGNSRIYIFFGKSLQEASQKVVTLLGGTFLPPLWAMGYQQCRWSYMSTKELREVIQKMEKEKIPMDSLYLDIDYMDGYRVFTTNQKTFGDLAQYLTYAKEKEIKNIFIVDPGVKIDESYSVYSRLKSIGSYLKNADGSDFIAKVWPGKTILPDFGDENTKEWWKNEIKEWVGKYDFDGIWNDMNEPSNFGDGNRSTSKSITTRGSLIPEYNLYGYNMAKASRIAFDNVKDNQRSFVITRSGYPGVQQFAINWQGDNMAWWEHLKLTLNTTIAYSLCGAFYTGADVPGFTGNPSDDLAIRFFQLGAFLPLFRGHSIYFAKDKEPYAFNKKTNEIIKQAIYLRYSLLREWYSGFEKATREKRSPYAPVFDTTDNFIADEFLLFDKFLVAPIIERDQVKRLIYLPQGDWYILGNTKEKLEGDTWITIDVTLETFPVFVKAGNVVVRNTVGKNTRDTLSKKESFEIYPDRNSEAKGYWYDDDGVSQNGKFERIILTYTKNTLQKTTSLA